MTIGTAAIEKKQKPRKDFSANPQHQSLLLFILKLGHQLQCHSSLPLGLAVSMMLVGLSHLVVSWKYNWFPIYTFMPLSTVMPAINESLKWNLLPLIALSDWFWSHSTITESADWWVKIILTGFFKKCIFIFSMFLFDFSWDKISLCISETH